MHVAYSLDPLEPMPSLFLAGPTPRDDRLPHWRAEALALLEQANFSGTVYVPEDRGWKLRKNFDEIEQIKWEQAALDAANVVVFWLCRDELLQTMPGFTTNIEFGRISRDAELTGKSFVLGYPKGTRKMGYLQYSADKAGAPVRHTLTDTLQSALRLLKGDRL